MSLIALFFTRNIQDTSTKLSGIICRPPEQIKFEYHDSNSVLWLDKSKKPSLDFDLDLEHSLPSRSMDGNSGFLHDGSPVNWLGCIVNQCDLGIYTFGVRYYPTEEYSGWRNSAKIYSSLSLIFLSH